MNVAKWPGSAAIRKCFLLACTLLVCAVGASAAQAAVGTLDASYAGRDPRRISRRRRRARSPRASCGSTTASGGARSGRRRKYTIQRFDLSGTWVDTGVSDRSARQVAGGHALGRHAPLRDQQRAPGELDARSGGAPVPLLLQHDGEDATRSTPASRSGCSQPASSDDLETMVIDKDSVGTLWATFTYANVPGQLRTPATCPGWPQRPRTRTASARQCLVDAGGAATSRAPRTSRATTSRRSCTSAT